MSDELLLSIAVGATAAVALTANYSRTPYDVLFDTIGKAHDVPPDLLRAIARRESNFNPKAYRKEPDGRQSRGMMQLLDGTARDLGRDPERQYEPAYSIESGALYLVRLKRSLGDKWSAHTWVAAYNAGAAGVLRRGVFNEAYASAVVWHWQLYQLAGLLRGRGLAPAA